MKPENYEEIPTKDKLNGYFQYFPGIYCRGCGRTFALYSYSAFMPSGFDENDKPFYKSCFECNEKNSMKTQ